MKNLCLLLILFSLGACGDKQYYMQLVENAQKFEGFFKCENNSYIDLIVDDQGLVIFNTKEQSLNSINPKNNTVGTHPIINISGVLPYANELSLLAKNYNYSSTTNDLEEDTSGSNITGSRRTDINLSLNGDNLKIDILIWDNATNKNINFVVAERTFNCKRMK